MTNRPIVLPDPEAAALEAAKRTIRIAEDIIRQGREFRLVLSGGSTPKRVYELFSGDPFRSRIHWNRVHFFWGDERCVRPDHPDSNYRMARDSFLQKLGIQEENIHRMKGEAPDPDIAARDYEEEIRKHFGSSLGSPPPSFDLVLLGMGTDGHTASLFPSTPALKEASRWVVANPVPKLETHRLTLTPAILNRAACIIFLVTGEDKAETLSRVLEGPLEPERLPSQLIHPFVGKLLWLLDRAAAARLKTTQEN